MSYLRFFVLNSFNVAAGSGLLFLSFLRRLTMFDDHYLGHRFLLSRIHMRIG